LPVNVTKTLDGLSPIILTKLAMGLHFNEVKIEAFGPGNALLATYKLKTTFVVSDIVGGSTMSLTEQVVFVFGILESDIDVNGTAVHSCWNQITNSQCP
jgi:type VI protein secretion system component Hcp